MEKQRIGKWYVVIPLGDDEQDAKVALADITSKAGYIGIATEDERVDQAVCAYFGITPEVRAQA